MLYVLSLFQFQFKIRHPNSMVLNYPTVKTVAQTLILQLLNHLQSTVPRSAVLAVHVLRIHLGLSVRDHLVHHRHRPVGHPAVQSVGPNPLQPSGGTVGNPASRVAYCAGASPAARRCADPISSRRRGTLG